MSLSNHDTIRDAILEVLENSLEAQLRAVRRLRTPLEEPLELKQGMSQVDMAYDILHRAAEPLHINDIIKRIETVHQIHVERESLASAITKKVKRGDRFVRTGKNTFALKKE
jgi:hypothetical protein